MDSQEEVFLCEGHPGGSNYSSCLFSNGGGGGGSGGGVTQEKKNSGCDCRVAGLAENIRGVRLKWFLCFSGIKSVLVS